MTCNDCLYGKKCIKRGYIIGTEQCIDWNNRTDCKKCSSFKNEADFVKVKHGKWSLKYIGLGHYWECSECAFKMCTMPKTSYCPNCGAKMNGGNTE